MAPPSSLHQVINTFRHEYTQEWDAAPQKGLLGTRVLVVCLFVYILKRIHHYEFISYKYSYKYLVNRS